MSMNTIGTRGPANLFSLFRNNDSPEAAKLQHLAQKIIGRAEAQEAFAQIGLTKRPEQMAFLQEVLRKNVTARARYLETRHDVLARSDQACRFSFKPGDTVKFNKRELRIESYLGLGTGGGGQVYYVTDTKSGKNHVLKYIGHTDKRALDVDRLSYFTCHLRKPLGGTHQPIECGQGPSDPNDKYKMAESFLLFDDMVGFSLDSVGGSGMDTLSAKEKTFVNYILDKDLKRFSDSRVQLVVDPLELRIWRIDPY